MNSIAARMTSQPSTEGIYNTSTGPNAQLPITRASGPAVFVGIGAAGVGGHPRVVLPQLVTFRTILLMHDNVESERQMLARHQVYRRLAPWIQETSLQIHPALTGWDANTTEFELLMEQMEEVGWEAVLFDQNLGPMPM
jgi:hypothetical protein